MPPRKKTTSSEAESSPSEDSNNHVTEQTEPESASPASNVGEQQLFFSTDGDEPDQERPNPYDQADQTQEKSSGSPVASSNEDKAESNAGGQRPNANGAPQGGHPPRQQAGNKKQSWQDRKRQKNKQRSKFKRPRKLPYEETETRPLEVGLLLEAESLQSEESINELASAFASCADAIDLDEFVVLSQLDLKEKIAALDFDLTLPPAPVREELIDILLDACLKEGKKVSLSGIIQIMEDGHGFLLQEKEDYRLKSQSVVIPQVLVQKNGLKTGQSVKGIIRAKMEESSCPVMLEVVEVMGGSPEDATRVTPFTELVPYYPLERMYLETHEEVEWDNVSMRVVDLVSPVGFGQRGLIVAPPRTGKTVLQQAIARALRQNNPKAHLIVLLVDERPEEVTDFRRQVPDAEVIASTFDESAESHVHAAEIVIEKARRMVEHNHDVVILLDSITRLARAYNTTMPNSGKILSGGVEATALQRPKRFFGSARNIEGGGSLTILGTALVETGSKMDEVIFEEFKGTGNMELHLDRELSNKRIFPALDFEKSGTRKEELLYHPDELNKIYSLRRSMKGVPPAEAMEMFIQRVRKTKNNPEFLMGLGR
ncbi:MAG: transcription termination factor Rho [Opitutales bacterium]